MRERTDEKENEGREREKERERVERVRGIVNKDRGKE